MHANSIHHFSFSLNPLTDQSYDLNIQFLNDQDTIVSKITFTFLQAGKGKDTLWDVFTKNGHCKSSLLEHLFDKKDEKAAIQASVALKAAPPSGPVVFVLDLQEPHTHYSPCHNCTETIAKCEEIVCRYFQSQCKSAADSTLKRAKKMHALFHSSLPVDFILCEGSLKMDILKDGGFTEREKAFFQSKTGAIAFCQLTEFFMNAFKFGQITMGSTIRFSAERYLHPISNRFAAFQACQISTVLYPSLYKTIYSPSSEFAKALSAVFSVTGEYNNSTGITTLNIARKV